MIDLVWSLRGMGRKISSLTGRLLCLPSVRGHIEEFWVELNPSRCYPGWRVLEARRVEYPVGHHLAVLHPCHQERMPSSVFVPLPPDINHLAGSNMSWGRWAVARAGVLPLLPDLPDPVVPDGEVLPRVLIPCKV